MRPQGTAVSGIASRPSAVSALKRVLLALFAGVVIAGGLTPTSQAGMPNGLPGTAGPDRVEPEVARAQQATGIRVPADRVLKLARVECPDGTCKVRRIQVRYEIGDETFDGTGRSPRTVLQGKSAIVRSKVPGGLRNQLRKGVESGAVVVFVTITSSNGSRISQSIRTGLMR